MKLMEYLEKLIPFLEPYPTWVRASIAGWIFVSAVIVVELLFFRNVVGIRNTESLQSPVSSPNVPGDTGNEASTRSKHRAAFITANSVEELRRQDGVRELLPLENEKTVARLPNGVYGFAVPWILYSSPAGIKTDDISLQRKSLGTAVMEMHKSQDGQTYIVGFVSQADLVRMGDQSKTTQYEVTLFFAPYDGFDEIVGVPVERIVSSNNRTIEDRYANDIVLQ
jgi:hypothetical protein